MVVCVCVYDVSLMYCSSRVQCFGYHTTWTFVVEFIPYHLTSHTSVSYPYLNFSYSPSSSTSLSSFGSCTITASDMGRAVLQFGVGHPLGKRGLMWLKVHLHGAKSN